MQRLILMRHGKAESGPAGGDDFDRPLAAQGRDAAAAMGRLLAIGGSAPDLALVSSSVRTVQTFEAARLAFPKAGERVSRALYLATAKELMSAIQAAADDAAVLMVVGHNPGMSELAIALAHGGRASPAERATLARGFPTAGAVVFDMDADGLASVHALHLGRGGAA